MRQIPSRTALGKKTISEVMVSLFDMSASSNHLKKSAKHERKDQPNEATRPVEERAHGRWVRKTTL